MTLLEIANYACRKINQTDAGDLVAAKSFAQQQFKLIWQSQLWKDSLVEFTQSLGIAADYAITDTWLPTKQILLCPTIVSHVIALRTADRKLNVQSGEIFYCKDFDDFQNTGRAVDYRLLAPVVWDFETAQHVQILGSNDADTNEAFADLINGTSYTRVTGNLPTVDLGTIETIATVQKQATEGEVTLTIATAITITNNYANAQEFCWLTSATSDSPDRLEVASGATVTMTFEQPVGSNWIGAFDVSTGGVPNFAEEVGPDFAGTITLNADGTFTLGTGDTLSTLADDDSAAAKRQRLQIIGAIDRNTVLRVLGKRTCPRFEEDSDEPGLTGVDNVLMALVHADMLERERHYGQAKLIFDKAGVMMEVLVKEQTVQQAHQKRIIPTDGFGAWVGSGDLSDNKFAPAPAETPVTINETSGSINLPNNWTGGRLSVSMSYLPASVTLTVTIPSGGLLINAFAIGGTLDGTGVDYALDGMTDSANYVLNYHFSA